MLKLEVRFFYKNDDCAKIAARSVAELHSIHNPKHKPSVVADDVTNVTILNSVA